jgi:heme/copper-type cytochrome/quinol oxidase subunit 3
MSTENPSYNEAVVETPAAKPKKKKKIFLWVFLAIQAIFFAWIIGGVNSASTHALDNCNGLSAQTCQSAAQIGTGIGVIVIIGLWLATDFIVGLTYGIYKLATRKPA